MSAPRIVIVGAGFGGWTTARHLSRSARGRAEIVLVNPTDYFLYLPLLPEVASGVLDPRRVTVSLADTLPQVRSVLGQVETVDVDARTIRARGPEGEWTELAYDRLVLAAGSVNKLLPIPGVAENAHGFRGIPEALHLRDHLIRQIELAEATDDPGERAARLTFVVVGAGYTGTEVVAQGQLLTDDVARHHRWLGEERPRWLLVDTADRVLPGMNERMSATAGRVLRERGVEVLLGNSVAEATAEGVKLQDGTFVPSRTLVWCVGVKPDPLASSTGLPMERGRLKVDEYLAVPGHPEILAVGDAAAVPDPQHPGQVTPMTAQHAVRQGKLAAHNLAASFGSGRPKPYRHRDLGFLVDLGGWQAAADPFHLPISGPPARLATRAYHLAALPANRIRTAADWAFTAVGRRPAVQLGLVPGPEVPLDSSAPELAHR